MLRTLLYSFVSPISLNEDSQRKEFILNVLLLSSSILFFTASIVSLLLSLFSVGMDSNFVSLIVLIGITICFFILYQLSRKGFSKISAHSLIGIFVIFAFWMSYQWSVDLQSSLLIYALTIVMAGILVNTKFAFFVTAFIAVIIFTLGFLQHSTLIESNVSWRIEPWKISDTIMTLVIFLIISTVSWLSNREIDRLLERAHKSERELRKERNQLEVKVEERTKALKEAQIEKVVNLYRFAEFGRLSSGLFHDLINPLTAVSLNIEKARLEKENQGDISLAKKYLDQAFSAAGKMEHFIKAVRKQISKDEAKVLFSLQEETQEVLEILSYKAQVNNVQLILIPSEDISIVGSSIRWNQVMLNIITNAIDAYDNFNRSSCREVVIHIVNKVDSIVCTITDYGAGIDNEYITKIFDPFFTTKYGKDTKGTGIGLSMVKDILEKDFNGTIQVSSDIKNGTIFVVTLLK